MKPPIPYFGGKSTTAARIAALMPACAHYVEAFAGSLAVLLAREPARQETVNDLDGQVVAFWRVLRDRPADLERACALTPHSRAEFEASYQAADSDLECARRVFTQLTQGRSAVRRRTGWRHDQAPSAKGRIPVTRYLGNYAARIAGAAERLAGVSLECKPALEIIARYGRHDGVLLYCDPPYLGSTRTAGDNYAAEMRAGEGHRELAGALRACRGAVVLSGYDSPLYGELYDGWHRAGIRARAGNGADPERTEVLWSNRPFAQGSLFDCEATA